MRASLAAVGLPVTAVVLVAGMLAGILGPKEAPGADAPCDAQQAGIGVDMSKLPSGAAGGFSKVQLLNAAKIMAAGKTAGLSARDQQIGLAVALGESDLGADSSSRTPNGDGDVGVFQQRAKPGWYADGATMADNSARLNNTTYAATTFFTGHDVKVAAAGGAGSTGYHIKGLADIKNRDQMSPSGAAHAVQGNADPDHYSKYWSRAVNVAKVVAAAVSGKDAAAALTTTTSGGSCPGAGQSGDSGRSGKDTYGPMWIKKGHPGGEDPWAFFWGQCVSYAAWMVRTTTGYSDFVNNYRGAHFGNANQWAGAARTAGIPVDQKPAVGAIAQRMSGAYGHVAYITKVNSDGSFDVNEYNHAGDEKFGSRKHAKIGPGADGFDNIIHFETKGKKANS